MAHVRKQHGAAGEQLEDLHGQRAVHVGFRRRDDRLVRAVHIVGIVEERLGDVHGDVAVGQVAVRLDPDEVQPPLRDDAAQAVVRAQLGLQLFGRQACAVVADLTDVPLQP